MQINNRLNKADHLISQAYFILNNDSNIIAIIMQRKHVHKAIIWILFQIK